MLETRDTKNGSIFLTRETPRGYRHCTPIKLLSGVLFKVGSHCFHAREAKGVKLLLPMLITVVNLCFISF